MTIEASVTIDNMSNVYGRRKATTTFALQNPGPPTRDKAWNVSTCKNTCLLKYIADFTLSIFICNFRKNLWVRLKGGVQLWSGCRHFSLPIGMIRLRMIWPRSLLFIALHRLPC